ncbi:hypothetical protein DSBG_4044 [Desulfosporosinus sp. BG]|nr:hypothetical protein DSBG_4044 [Desulfosporosinus sp. BG]
MHSPSKAQSLIELSSIIHVANGLAGLVGIRGGVDSLFNPIEPKESDLKLFMGDIEKFLVDPSLFS